MLFQIKTLMKLSSEICKENLPWTNGNQSQQRLMNALVQLLNHYHSLDKISVQRLIAEAGASRSTFYRNFDDKPDFLNWVIDNLITGIRTAVNRTGLPGEPHPFQNYYRYLNQQRSFFQAFVTLNRWPEFSDAMFQSGFTLYYQQLKKLSSSVDPTILATYIVAAHIRLSHDWLIDDDPQTTEKMAEQTTILTRNGLLKGLGLDQLIKLPS